MRWILHMNFFIDLILKNYQWTSTKDNDRTIWYHESDYHNHRLNFNNILNSQIKTWRYQVDRNWIKSFSSHTLTYCNAVAETKLDGIRIVSLPELNARNVNLRLVCWPLIFLFNAMTLLMLISINNILMFSLLFWHDMTTRTYELHAGRCVPIGVFDLNYEDILFW